MKLRFDVSFHAIERLLQRFPKVAKSLLLTEIDSCYQVDESAYTCQLEEWVEQLRYRQFSDHVIFKQVFSILLKESLIINGSKCGFTSNDLFAFNKEHEVFFVFGYIPFKQKYVLKTVMNCDYRAIFKNNVWDHQAILLKIKNMT